MVFQSTPPARGATCKAEDAKEGTTISIHAPREGGDDSVSRACYTGRDFNPRPPRGGRHLRTGVALGQNLISIHAPREGGDFIDEVSLIWDNHFNPRPPRGGRPVKPRTQKKGQRFQSTPPARGATTACQEPVILAVISIHAPREGGDTCGPGWPWARI